MEVVDTIEKLRERLNALRWAEALGASGQYGPRSVGLVPTMGHLHEGHLDLVRCSTRENEITVGTIFVNPTQFNRSEDFELYPRNEARDVKMFRDAGTHLVFVPKSKEIMYPNDHSTQVTCEPLASRLEGSFRPGHFNGVTLIVTKLLNLVQPSILYLGAKDAQQCVVLSRLVKDLNYNTQVRIVPTHRDPNDGLALSSRNALLSETERKIAPTVYLGLRVAQLVIESEPKLSTSEYVKEIVSFIYKTYGERAADDLNLTWNVEYVSTANRETLQEINGALPSETLLSVAVMLGRARLIDNIVLHSKATLISTDSSQLHAMLKPTIERVLEQHFQTVINQITLKN